uniref:Transposon protein, putative, unclassified n=1 Tax=Oryza sativa subsp. japonica TaxID=39947 RepID=Q33AB9_ORYSJ|nr:transposon protein, putative, unclassified [Oryza sativa Japonica Group]
MSWHRAGVLLLGAQSCLPVPGVPAVGWLRTSWDPGSGCQFGLNHHRPWVKAVVVLSLAQFFPSPEEELLEDEGFGV